MACFRDALLLFFCCTTVIFGYSVDNSLSLVKTDCFERMAVGERLKSGDVLKSLPLNTVKECQVACTEQEDKCRSFSFGIGPKGNGTCELSSKIIKETAQLKPIGTRADNDYDLYIKKMGCQMVVEQGKPAYDFPVNTEVPSYLPKPVNKSEEPAKTQIKPDATKTENYEYLVGSQSSHEKYQKYQNLGGNTFYGSPQKVYSSLISVSPEVGGNKNGYGEENVDRYDRPNYLPPDGHTNHYVPAQSYENKGNYFSHYQGYSSYSYENQYGERPFGGKPSQYGPYQYGQKPFEGKPGQRPYEDRNEPYQYGQKPFGDKLSQNGVYQHDQRPFEGTPGQSDSQRPYEGKPSQNEPYLYGQRPFGDKLSQRPFYGKPTPNEGYQYNERPFEDRPSQNEPYQHSQIPSEYDQRPLGNKPTHIELYKYGQRPQSEPLRPTYESSRPFVVQDPASQYLPPHKDFYWEKSESNKGGYENRVTYGGYAPLYEYGDGYWEALRPPKEPYVQIQYTTPIVSTSKPLISDNLGDFQSGDKDHQGFYFSSSKGYTYEKPTEATLTSKTTPQNATIETTTPKLTTIDDDSTTKIPCYRRALSGKRIQPAFARRILHCESLDACHMECSFERSFNCEGFNYVSTPGRRGLCELLDIPLSRLDIQRDLLQDAYSDYYEKDRNNNRGCNNYQNNNGYQNSDGYQDNYYPIGGYYDRRPYDNKEQGFYDTRKDYYYPRPRPPADGYYDRRPDYYDYQEPNRRGDSYGYYHQMNSNNVAHYQYNRYKQRNPYRKPVVVKVDLDGDKYYKDREKGGNYWGYSSYSDNYGYNYPQPNQNAVVPNRNYLPSKTDGYSYDSKYYFSNNRKEYHIQKYSPEDVWVSEKNNAFGGVGYNEVYDSTKNECSLRTKSGFKLRRVISKKILAVEDIYRCEFACFEEKDFVCQSYAFRYTQTPSAPPENCFLSPKNYKQLDFYADLEPDRDFDVYTMNNPNFCDQPKNVRRQESDCFWRVRSGQRLDASIVRAAIDVNSVVDCQVKCIQSVRFACRAFSYRYGSQVIGSATQNCLLTDWPFYELNPKKHFVADLGFEVYDRGSYGYGCEATHFSVRGREDGNDATKINDVCYVSFNVPARLLPTSVRYSLEVESELDCKDACTKARKQTLFQCMSFSYRKTITNGIPNCVMSDVLQRDLQLNTDYIPDPDSLLFAWDNYNPQCFDWSNSRSFKYDEYAEDESGSNSINGREEYGRQRYGKILGHFTALDTWRVYSVNGHPCRRGTTCRQNTIAGFYYCELEDSTSNTWDYCCRPDHQCGYSEGFPYQWCYVGPERTQWRKCSERYHPYVHYQIAGASSDRVGYKVVRPGVRPDRLPLPDKHQAEQQMSLDDYESQFDSQFLAPPKPGGFDSGGGGRRWPVSYLHKERPYNTSGENDTMKLEQNNKTGRAIDSKYAAIQNLIDIIKSNDVKDVKYQISNDSNKIDDVLYVKIPLPGNFTKETNTEKTKILDDDFKALDTVNVTIEGDRKNRALPVVRKGYVERTNVSNYGLISLQRNVSP